MTGSLHLSMDDARAPQHLLRTTLVYAAAVVVMAVLCAATYGIFDRAMRVNRAADDAVRSIEQQRTLTQRLAGLAAIYALGDVSAAARLDRTADALLASETAMIAGSARREVPAVRADSALRGLYFAGQDPLDSALRNFARDAQRTAALRPHDARLATAASALFAAGETRLPAKLDAAIGLRQAAAQRRLASLTMLAAVSLATLLATVVIAAVAIVGPLLRASQRLARRVAQYAQAATIDPLTGTLNRRGFNDRGTLEIAKARRYNRPLTLLMIDPDQLTPITQRHGPAVGDRVLQALTETLADGTRTTDLVGRVGDEAFAVLLPETDLAGAELLAERLRRRIGDLVVSAKDAAVSCTVSIGVAAAEKDATFLWPTFQRAGEALYEAQMRGRNRVFVNAAA